MTTTKKRILVTLSPPTARALDIRARREQTPRATIAARIIENELDSRRIWLSEKEADLLFRKLHTV